MKLKETIKKLKHSIINANYKVRYNNLLKRYETLDKEYTALLGGKYSDESIYLKLKEAKQLAIKYKNQRDNIRKDYKELCEKYNKR